MDLVEVVIIAVGLAMDACAVSLAAGASGRARGKRSAFRLSFHFGLFQFIMPVIGWYVGSGVAVYFGAVDHWVAFGLLAFVGGRMIRAGFSGGESMTGDPSRGMTLVALSLATSIDALAVGLSLAMLRVDIWQPSALIGLITAGLSLAGLRFGRMLGPRFGNRMEVAGGLLLILIGVQILLRDLLA